MLCHTGLSTPSAVPASSHRADVKVCVLKADRVQAKDGKREVGVGTRRHDSKHYYNDLN